MELTKKEKELYALELEIEMIETLKNHYKDYGLYSLEYHKGKTLEDDSIEYHKKEIAKIEYQRSIIQDIINKI